MLRKKIAVGISYSLLFFPHILIQVPKLTVFYLIKDIVILLEAKFEVSIAQTAKIFKSAKSIFSLFLAYKEHTQATIVHVL